LSIPKEKYGLAIVNGVQFTRLVKRRGKNPLTRGGHSPDVLIHSADCHRKLAISQEPLIKKRNQSPNIVFYLNRVAIDVVERLKN